MRAFCLTFVFAFASASLTSAAELPSRSTTTQTAPKARECNIAGQRGMETPNGVCIRLSGYVSAGVEGGNVKH